MPSSRTVSEKGNQELTTERPELRLHEAMEQVLRTRGNEPMTAQELADAINAGRLYWQWTRGGGPVPREQIHGRVGKYPERFERVPGGIRIRDQR